MAKKEKKAAKVIEVSWTPGSTAYRVALEGLQSAYASYAEGAAQDEHITTPAKQRKVAKQIAKMHNRLLKRSKLPNIEELDEDVQAVTS